MGDGRVSAFFKCSFYLYIPTNSPFEQHRAKVQSEPGVTDPVRPLLSNFSTVKQSEKGNIELFVGG